MELKIKVPLPLIVTLTCEPDGDGYFVHSDLMPGLLTDGDTVQEAEENARDAILCHLASMIKHGEPLPPAVAVDRELLGLT